MYQAIRRAIDELRTDDTSIAARKETYDAFSNGRKQEEIAFDLYGRLILGEKISKPIVAQHFAAAVEKAKIDDTSLADKNSTGYLIDAIQYVTSGSNNR